MGNINGLRRYWNVNRWQDYERKKREAEETWPPEEEKPEDYEKWVKQLAKEMGL